MQAPLAVSAPLRLLPAPPDDQAAHVLDLAPSSGGFRTLSAAFRASGGIARADDLARLLCDRVADADAGDGDGDGSSLDHLLARAKVFSFAWRDRVWLPMFQFDLRRLSVQQAPQQVRAELLGTCATDGWDCASWFALPHAALQQRAPVDMLAFDLPGVLNAARADRWVLTG